MRTRFLLLAVLISSLFTIGRSQEKEIYYVRFADGRVWGYPKEYVKEVLSEDGGYTIVLMDESEVSWTTEEVVAIDEIEPTFPQFTAFKLDDKLNDQLFRDVEAAVTESEVWASVSGIGKYLTPTFELDAPNAVAYVDGKEQVSGESRLRFAREVVYTLSFPGYERLSAEKVGGEAVGPASVVEEIALTEGMLSTNAPTSFADEGLGMMLDGDPNTIFHSTWSKDPVYSVDLSKQVYVSVALPYAISDLKFYYMGRSQTGYNIEEWKIEASHDGEQWTYITTLGGLPTDGGSVSYTSDAISLGAAYNHVRFVATRSQYKNYLCLGEFRLYEVRYESEDAGAPLQGYQMVPMGREVPVRIDWLTDYATSVPLIDIYIDGGEMVTSKEKYLKAHISFHGSGVWDDYDFKDSVKIKGRGNSSWSTPSSYYDPKNPYRLKFDESVKPFGMKKGKNWNLIAQKQTGSLMTNPVAHKIARMVGLQTANDVVPVELYMNGEYRGSYYFTQKVGMANNSVDFDDESQAALFELDSYKETGQFNSDSYGLPVNIKAPEFGEDETLLDYYGVVDEFNRFETAVCYQTNFERFVDMDMLVRYMLVNELVLNTELGHPKSAFLYRENMNHMASRYTFGPAWDFDWAYGYEETSSYCKSRTATRDIFSYFDEPGSYFFSNLLHSSDWVKYRYYKLWEEFIEKHLDELIDFVDDYYAYARSSFVSNSYVWGDGDNYDTNVENMKSWLSERAHYIKESLRESLAYDPNGMEPFAYGDIDGDGTVDNHDIELMLAALFDAAEGEMSYNQMDADANGTISLSDLTWINLLVGDETEALSRSRREHALWASDREENVEDAYDFDVDDMQKLIPSNDGIAKSAPVRSASNLGELGLVVEESKGQWNVEVALVNPTPYIAYSMDIVVPETFVLSNGDEVITLSYRTEGSFATMGHWVGNDVYRVIGYSRDNTAMTDAEGPLFTLSLRVAPSIVAGNYALSVKNIHMVTENAEEEYLANAFVAFEVDEKQLSNLETLEYTPCWPADVYDVHGRLVRKAATSLDGLSRGVYMVNNQKVVR